MKIITHVKEPTDWVSRLVIVEKLNGHLRIQILYILIKH